MTSRLAHFSVSALLLVCFAFLSGCATPVGVSKISPREAYNEAYANPLNAGVLSDESKYVLNRYDLLNTFESEPAEAIAVLHKKALQDNRTDILYTLAEASYLYGTQLLNSTKKEDQKLAPDYFLLCALYSFYFVSGESSSQRQAIFFDYRARNAIDLYNFSLWQGLVNDGEGVAMEAAERKLPFGSISITVDTTHFPWNLADIKTFLPAYEYKVRGVLVRNRRSGVGIPLIALSNKKDNEFTSDQSVPATAFLRIQGDLAALNNGAASGVLELYSTWDTSIIQSKYGDLPLDSDLTVPLAYDLEGSTYFDLGLRVFLGREASNIPDGLYMTQPYRPGKIPVVFVHGTASNPVWWTEMFNTLSFDPLIREKYQFWYFVYTSNKVIEMSAGELRDALTVQLTKLDPNDKNRALQQMVVVGHSQGGLLTKYTAVDTGEKLVQALTGTSLDSLDMSAENKHKLRQLLVLKPLPFVKTVIFLSTPHRGSYLSQGWTRSLLRSLVSLPAKFVQTPMDMYEYMTDDIKKVLGGKVVITSADSMSPENPVIRALAEIPLASGIEGHSIIAVQGEGDSELGDDGVVEYKSAHLDGMASELIVSGGHSSQLNPLAIDEVRRILVDNLSSY